MGFEGFEDSLARPFVVGVEAQGFAEMLHGVFRHVFVEQRPAHIGVGCGVFGIVMERGVEGGSGFFAAAELGQGDAAQVDAVLVFRIVGQSFFRCPQGFF